MTSYNWKKLGLIFKPEKKIWWLQSHAMIPTPHIIDSNLCKVYFSGRDKDNRSHIGFFVVNLEEPSRILDLSKQPVLSPGDIGSFDDNGVTPSCVVENNTDIFMYYIGWNPGFNVRMHLFGGLAVSQDNGNTFERYSKAPIIERNRVNPFLNTAPYIVKDHNLFRMYYVSGVEWIHKDLPRYNIQIAYSNDGINWERNGVVAINFKNDNEMALARPWVIKENGIYKMWFSYKNNWEDGSTYNIGYAESNNGDDWLRKDKESGIKTSKNGWDSEMIEYAAVVPYKDKLYMFYNGNNYGFDGVGLAVAKR
ncbi:hypothetical protein HOB87_05755 [Candidatus Woesearchaeota archaeon]|jgi:predicted GH43/DUF377 family glycosyl hydrolase|nr:hypothetical protein [Candidatus Woesearchaeota archaeon]MBT5400277.1 hypothetical protein [bacterium]